MRRVRTARSSSGRARARSRGRLGAPGALAALAVAALVAAPAAGPPSRGEAAGAVAVTPAPGIGLHHQIVANARAIRDARAHRRAVRARLAERVLDLYRTEPPGPLEVVLIADSLSDALETYRLLERVSGHDEGLAYAVDATAARIAYLRAERAALKHAWRERLAAIAHCESRGRPGAVSPGGRYRGKYQFDLRTWRSVGGRGDPAAAPEAEQDARAAALYRRRGASPWPVCGPPAG